MSRCQIPYVSIQLLRRIAVVGAACIGLSCHPAPQESNGLEIPYPNSVRPAEVLANIRAIVTRQAYLARDMKMPELAMRNNELRVGRVLQVRSVGQPGPPPLAYLVVDLEDLSGNVVAMFAMTREGRFMGIQDCRPCPPGSGPLGLAEASARVRACAGNPKAVEYVYLAGGPEPGYSRFRPVAAVTTERGTVYLNSRGQAFAEERSTLLRECGATEPTRIAPGPPPLRLLGQW
jgi:hypothetical protein